MESTGDAVLDKFVERVRQACKPLDLKLKAPPSIPSSPKNMPLIGAVAGLAIAGVGWLAVKAVQGEKSWTDRVAQNQQPDAPVSGTTRPSR